MYTPVCHLLWVSPLNKTVISGVSQTLANFQSKQYPPGSQGVAHHQRGDDADLDTSHQKFTPSYRTLAGGVQPTPKPGRGDENATPCNVLRTTGSHSTPLFQNNQNHQKIIKNHQPLILVWETSQSLQKFQGSAFYSILSVF